MENTTDGTVKGGTLSKIELLAKELGVPVEKLQEKMSDINKVSSQYQKEKASELKAAEEALINREFGLAALLRSNLNESIARYEAKHGQVQRGTQMMFFFTARKDGSNPVVCKVNVKGEQTARWIDSDGKVSTSTPKNFKRERKTPTEKTS